MVSNVTPQQRLLQSMGVLVELALYFTTSVEPRTEGLGGLTFGGRRGGGMTSRITIESFFKVYIVHFQANFQTGPDDPSQLPPKSPAFGSMGAQYAGTNYQ